MFVDLRELPIPSGLITRSLANKNLTDIRVGNVGEPGIDRPQFEAIVAGLHSPELDQLIREGRLSVGLIKAQAFEGTDLPENDDSAAMVILDEIGSERLLFKMPWKFVRGEVADFYLPLFEPYRETSAIY